MRLVRKTKCSGNPHPDGTRLAGETATIDVYHDVECTESVGRNERQLNMLYIGVTRKIVTKGASVGRDSSAFNSARFAFR